MTLSGKQINVNSKSGSGNGASNSGTVSVFPNTFHTKPIRETTIPEILEAIKGEAYRDRIEAIRRIAETIRQTPETDTETLKAEKERLRKEKANLPAVTFSGRFDHRKKDDPGFRHSGCIVMDLDHLPDIEEARRRIEADPHTAFCFRSPSGDGLKAGYLVSGEISDDEGHKRAFAVIAEHLKEAHGLEIDPSGKDISRLCYLSLDPDLYRCANPVPFELPDPAPTREEIDRERAEMSKGIGGTDKKTDYGRKVLEAACRAIEQSPPGAQHHERVKKSRLVGGLIPDGMMDHQEAIQALEAAVRASGAENIKAAMKTIEDGLKNGMADPFSWEKIRAEQIEYGKACRPPQYADEAENNDDWRVFSDPVPFATENATAPEIDPCSVPALMREVCLAFAEEKQVPFELTLACCLGVTAVATQRKFVTEIKPGYREPTNLYLACALPPADRKSATLKEFKKPVQVWEAERAAEMKDEIEKARSRKKSYLKLAESSRAKAGKAESDFEREKLLEEADKFEMQAEEEIPVEPRFFADDITAETLSDKMKEQGEKIGIVEAEGGIFDTLGGRYQNGTPNLDIVLKSFTGDSVIVDRKNNKTTKMTNPALTLCICPQPEVIRQLREKPGFLERGFIGRFLYWFAKSRMGFRRIDSKKAPAATVAKYDRAIRNLLPIECERDDYGNLRPHVLKLSDEAKQAWVEFANEVEKELRPGGEFENMLDWGGRLAGQAVRLAANFHLFENSEQPLKPISGETMRMALNVSAVLSKHAATAYEMMGCDSDTELAKDILRWIKSDGESFETTKDGFKIFCPKDVFNRFRGRNGIKMQVLEPALNILLERGFINALPVHRKAGPGRPPKPRYACFPGIFLKNK